MATQNTKTTIADLGPYDVLCGRDKKCNSNEGNHRFRVLINASLPRYMACNSKFERSKTIGAIVKELQENPQGSIRFFKRVKGSSASDDNALTELLDEKASREKVAHALRDYAAQHQKTMARRQESTPAPQSVSRVSVEQPDMSTIDQFAPTSYNAHNPHSPPIADMSLSLAEIQNQIAALEQARSSMANNDGSLEGPRRVSGMEAAYNDYSMPPPSASRSSMANNDGSLEGPRRVSEMEAYNDYSMPPPSAPRSSMANNDGLLEGPRRGSEMEAYKDYDYSMPPPSAPPQRALHTMPPQRNLQYTPSDRCLGQQQQLPPTLEDHESSERYDDFDDLHPLPTGASTRSMMDGIEKMPSERSFKTRGSMRSMEGSINRSFKNPTEVFDRNASGVFDRTASGISMKSKDTIDELMQMSMDTLSLNESTSYMRDSSILSFDHSKLDMSKLEMSQQQSKLNMSLQTMDQQ